jgi:hypothetical protein
MSHNLTVALLNHSPMAGLLTEDQQANIPSVFFCVFFLAFNYIICISYFFIDDSLGSQYFVRHLFIGLSELTL